MGCSASGLLDKNVIVCSADGMTTGHLKFRRDRAKSTISNVSSVLGVDKTKIRVPLTERQIMALTTSWEKVHQDITQNGQLMFIRMFETKPDVKTVFEKFTNVDDPTEMWQAEVLKVHGMTVMAAIDDIIINMDDKETVIELMLEQGQSHSHFGEHISADTFWAIEEPFLTAVREVLGKNYSAYLQDIYEKAIHFILDTFVKGFNEAVRKEQKFKKNAKATVIDTSSVIDKSVVSLPR